MNGKINTLKWALSCCMLLFIGTTLVGIKGDAEDVLIDAYPHIEVFMENEQTQAKPYALIGQKFSLFSVKAIDGEGGISDCEQKVYYNYYSDKRVNVPTENGAFVPSREGIYTIVYTAVDYAGNQSSKEIDVVAYQDSPLTIEVKGSEQPQSIKSQIVIAEPVIENNSGDYTVTATAKVNDVVYSLEKTQEGYTFTPMHAGVFDVKFTYSDYVQSTTASLSLTVQTGSGYEFVERPALSDYFIKNAKYAFDKAYYYDMSQTELKAKEALIKIAYDNADERQEVDGFLNITGNEKATVYYYAGTQCFYQKDVTIVDCSYDPMGLVDMRNYFYDRQGDFVVAEGLGNSSYPAYTTDKDASLDYVNKLLVDDFYIALGYVQGAAETVRIAGKTTITLTDWYDSDNILKIELSPKENGNDLDVTVNDRYEYKVPNGSYIDGKAIEVAYSTIDNTLTVGGSTFGLNGVFQPFARHYAKLNIAVSELDAPITLEMRSLNNQARLSVGVLDMTNAQKYFMTNANYFEIGSVLTFKSIVGDLISPYSEVKLSLTTPQGGYAVTQDGITLQNIYPENREYNVLLDSYGIYTLKGESQDEFGNVEQLSLTIRVVDYQEPTVTPVEKIESVRVGTTKTLAFTATDTVDTASTLKMRIVVYDAKSVPTVYDSENGSIDYKFEQVGIYVISCYCYDSYGNMGIYTYSVSVN